MATLSIIIPNFNHANYLPEVIESCFNQRIKPLEVIVIDDASTDDSLQVLNKLSLCHPSLKIITSSVNHGVAMALNTGIDASEGDWLLLRAADDLCPINSFQTFYNALHDHPEAGVITGDVAYFDGKLKTPTQEKLGRSKEVISITTDNYLQHYGNNIIHGVTTFCRRSWIQKAGKFDPQLYWHCDWFLLMEMGINNGFIYIPEVLGYMRINALSYNAAGTSSQNQQTKVLQAIVDKLEKKPILLYKFLEFGCLDFFGTSLLKLLKNSSSKRQLRFKLLLQQATQEIENARSNVGHAWVFRRFIKKHLKKIKQHDTKIAFYGAGGHTQQLLKIWNEFQLSLPCLIIESKTQKKTFMDISLKSVSDLNKDDCNLIILSSKSYEPLLASSLKKIHPELFYLKIWGNNNE